MNDPDAQHGGIGRIARRCSFWDGKAGLAIRAGHGAKMRGSTKKWNIPGQFLSCFAGTVEAWLGRQRCWLVQYAAACLYVCMG